MKDSTDFELIQLYIKGNNRAFEILYARHRNRLYYFISQLLNNAKSEIDDVFQTVWVKAIDRMPQLRNDGSFSRFVELQLPQTAVSSVFLKKYSKILPH